MQDADSGPRPARVTLVLGGTRSGKSAFAESLVERAPRPVYVATAEQVDGEMSERIARHRARRGERWTTVEAPIDLPAVLAEVSAPDAAVLVDCLTVWLGNLMHHERDLDADRDALLESLAAAPGPVVLVASEVGLGIVPESALGRAFRDRAGELNQAVARQADAVHLIVAGIAMPLKGGAPAGV